MRIADFFIPSVTCKKRKQDHTPPTSTRKYEKLSCPYCSKTCDGNAALQNYKISKHSREMNVSINAKQRTLFEYSTAVQPQESYHSYSYHLPSYKINDSL